jgi:hypothetical protein
MKTPFEDGSVQQLVNTSIFSFALPASHRAKWKARRLEFGRDPHKFDSLLPYLTKFKRAAEADTAFKIAAHALVTGLGLLFIFNDKAHIADIIDLVLLKLCCVADARRVSKVWK